MTDRDRLIELIRRAKTEVVCCTSDGEPVTKWQRNIVDRAEANTLADYLLANGVIVPPCKVGQTVYVPNGDEESDWIDEYKVKYFYCSSKGINRYYIECGTMGNNFRPKDIGKTVFLTKEEAEAKLKELKDNG